MKQTFYLFLIVVLVSSCNSYDHESYVEKFKNDFDHKLNSYTLTKLDSSRIEREDRQSAAEYRLEKIENNRFYIDNYSWYQLGNNLMLSPEEAENEANKYGFIRPFYFLEFLKSDTTKGPVKKKVINDVRNRLYAKHGKDSVQIFGLTTSDLFSAVKRHEKYKYFFFLKVEFEKAITYSDKQKKVAAQMFQGAFKRLLENTVVKDNLFHITVTKGEQIGISENLFHIGKGMLNDANKEIVKIRKTNPNYAMDLDPSQARLVDTDWETAYSLHKKYANK